MTSSSQDDIARQILEEARKASQLGKELDEYAQRVCEYWRSQSPVGEGRYAASVKVFKKKFTVDGMPARRVGATDFKAHWIEYGTGSDKKGDSPRYVPTLGVQVGKDTPTPAFAPRAKTAAHFGGDETRVYSQDIEDSQ